jgi:ubiquinol-cytochrome c reductase cytochrome c subunit
MTALTARRRHPLAGVVVLLLGLVLMGTLYAAFAPPSEARVPTVAQPDLVAEGRDLFTIGCSSCHGLGGQGLVTNDGVVLGPSLVGVGAAAVDFQVGTGRMPAAGPNAQIPEKEVAYTDEQRAALAAFVASLGPGPAIPSPEQYDPALGDAALGGELYRTNCASCHNTSGQGGALTGGRYAPALTGVEPIHMYQAMLTGPQSMPVFSDAVLTSEQKRDIIAFLTTVSAEDNPGGLGIGRIGPVSEGLWGWLVGIGALLGAAIWIGAKSS